MPYVPGIVPTADQSPELERYLKEETTKISEQQVKGLNDLDDVTLTDPLPDDAILVYDTETGQWGAEELFLRTALLYGAAPSVNSNPPGQQVTNYASDANSDTDVFTADPVAGTITINEDGVYSFTAWLLMTQPGNQKNEDLFMELDITGVGASRGVIDAREVASNQSTWRSLQVTFTRSALQGMVLSLYVNSTGAGLGTMNIINSTFQVTRLFEASQAQSATIPMVPP